MLKHHALGLRLRTLLDLGFDFFEQRHRFWVLNFKSGDHVRALQQALLIRLVSNLATHAKAAKASLDGLCRCVAVA